MKIVITTTYDGVNEDFVEYYLKRMEKAPVLPGCQSVVPALRKFGVASMVSQADPYGPGVATTTYAIHRNSEEDTFLSRGTGD